MREVDGAARWQPVTAADAAGSPAELAGWDAMWASQFNPDDARWRAAEVQAYRQGPLANAMLFRGVTMALDLISAPFSYGWRVLGLFLIGAALMKLEFFHPRRRTWHRRLALLGLGVGLPLELLAAWLIWSGGFGYNWRLLPAWPLHEIGSLALAAGYAGLIALTVASGRAVWLVQALAVVGRLALTNYLLQSLLATSIMYWWGLALFDEVSRVGQIGLVAAIFAGQVLFSTLWLRRFRFGPVEWLWRAATYWTIPPLRRAAVTS